MRLDPWVENYSCDGDHGHGSCCCVSGQVAGVVADGLEQSHDAVGGSERSLAGGRLVCCWSSAAEHLSLVAAHRIQEEAVEDNHETSEKTGVEHEDHYAVAEEDCDS